MSPLLFVFETICKDDEQFSDDLEVYPELLERDWFLFWEKQGEDIVNSSWLKLYSEYVVKEEEGSQEVADVNASKGSGAAGIESQEITNGNSEQNCVLKISEDQEAGSTSSLNGEEKKNCVEVGGSYTPNEAEQGKEGIGAKTWQDLWDEHYLTKYQDTYKLFQFVHYQQFCFHRPALIETLEDPPAEEVECEVETINQTEELKSLGLPTSFGGRNNKHRSYATDNDSESLSEEDLEMSPKCREETKTRARKKKKTQKKITLPKMIQENQSLRKYWFKRFSLFSRFDEGIQLDTESWFSVTPEKVAIHMAERLACDTIIDGFCGSGGNAIQFATKCSKVIAIDIDPEKIKNARHNASIYGVAHKIDFIVGDFLQLSSSLKGDVVFLSPPWGGPQYISAKVYDIEESLVPLGATALAEKSRQISENIVFFLPKNSNREQIKKLAGVGNRVEIEHNYLNTRLVGLTAIYGDWLIDKKNLCQ